MLRKWKLIKQRRMFYLVRFIQLGKIGGQCVVVAGNK